MSEESDSGSRSLNTGGKEGSRADVEVEIFGQKYRVKGDVEENYIRSLAAYVDGKMNEVAGRMQGGSTAKVAVLMALNMSHELFQVRKELEEKEGMVSKKTRKIIELIENQL